MGKVRIRRQAHMGRFEGPWFIAITSTTTVLQNGKEWQIRPMPGYDAFDLIDFE